MFSPVYFCLLSRSGSDAAGRVPRFVLLPCVSLVLRPDPSLRSGVVAIRPGTCAHVCVHLR